MDVYAGPALYRRPAARAVRVGGAWLVDPGDVLEPVLPADVPRADPDVLPNPLRLRESLHEVVRSLRDVRDDDDPGKQAERLAAHYRQFGALDLCTHGRPMWHWDRPIDEAAPGTSCLSAGGEEPVEVVLRFVTAIEAIVTGGAAAAARRELPAWTLEYLAPLLREDLRKVVQGERGEAGGLTPARRRQVLELAATQLLKDCAVDYRVMWAAGRGPALVLTAGTSTGLYVLDVARTLGRSSPPPVYQCSECGAEVQRKRPPQPGEGVYCTRQECRRAKSRINTQRARARAKEGNGVQ